MDLHFNFTKSKEEEISSQSFLKSFVSNFGNTWGRGLGIDQKLTNSRELIKWASLSPSKRCLSEPFCHFEQSCHSKHSTEVSRKCLEPM